MPLTVVSFGLLMSDPDFSASHYEVLMLRPDASTEEIRSAWRRMVRQHHPDRCGTADGQLMQRINRAYEVLTNSHQRAQHDVDLQRERRGARPSRSNRRIRTRLPRPWVLAGVVALAGCAVVWTSFRSGRPTQTDTAGAALATAANSDAPLALVPARRLDSWNKALAEHRAAIRH